MTPLALLPTSTAIKAPNFDDGNALIRDQLGEYLLQDFPLVAQNLMDSPGPESNEAAKTGSDGFIIMPQCNFVAKFGPDYFDVSMKVLDEMTRRFTAKGSTRPFIQK